MSHAGPRVAGAPISWGVCEVPGWGHQLEPDVVLSQMSALGLRACELGPQGWLPLDGGRVRELLGRYGLSLVGGFVPLVLHEHDLAPTREQARRAAAQMAAAGADVLVAAVVADFAWSEPSELDGVQWRRLADHLHEIAELAQRHGLQLVLHPHEGTQIQTFDEVERALELTDVPWCLDTGHLLIGGVDPIAFVRDHGARIAHVHLKDVDAALAESVRAGERTLVQATQEGLFRPLGKGDAGIDKVVELLLEVGYDRWLVLEQDTAIVGPEPPDGGGPAQEVRESLEFLNTTVPRREERVHR